MGTSKRMERHSPKRLGEKLLKIREAFGDTQAAFLERLGNPDAILQTSVSAYEKRKREPPLLILLKYAEIANVSTDILINDSLDLPNKIPSRKKIFAD